MGGSGSNLASSIIVSANDLLTSTYPFVHASRMLESSQSLRVKPLFPKGLSRAGVAALPGRRHLVFFSAQGAMPYGKTTWNMEGLV